MKLRLVLGESLRSLFSNLATSIAATMSVLIGMFLLGLCIALGTWVVSWTDHVKKELTVRVYFCGPPSAQDEAARAACDAKESTAKQEQAVLAAAQQIPEVKQVRFVSKKEAFVHERKERPDLYEGVAYNPLPDALTIVPERGEDVALVAERLRPLPAGVQAVKWDRKTSQRVLRVAQVVESIFIIAALVMLAAATLLIANTIRLSIFSRRREIEVMKLVGATNWFVRGPFMLEGVICGLVGSLTAVALLLLGKEVALPAILGRVDTASDVKAMAFSLNVVILIVVGLLMGAAGSGLTVRRYLKI